MCLKEYVYFCGDGYFLVEKYYIDFIDYVSYWSGDWLVDKWIGGIWNIDKVIILWYIKDYWVSVIVVL